MSRLFEVDIKELRAAMAETGIYTAKGLADRLGVSRNTAETLLNGKRYPSTAIMQGLVDLLSLDGERAGRIFFARKLA